MSHADSKTRARRVWIQASAGSLSRLGLVSDQIAAPSSDQVQIRVRACGLNFADIFAILGLYSATPSGAFTPGLEFSGEIAALGDIAQQKTGFRPGDRIMGLTRFGAYTDLINVDYRYIRKIPSSWSFEQGAAFLAQGLTAEYAISDLGSVKKGETVLVQSAAGGVGLISLFLLEQLGAHAIAVVGSPSKIDLLVSRGVKRERILLRNASTFRKDLGRAAPDGIDVCLDAVYGPFFKPQYDALRAGGRYVLFGAASMMPEGKKPNYLRLAFQYLRRPALDPLAMISDNKSLLAFNLIWLWDQTDRLSGLADRLLTYPWQNNPPFVGKVFSFEKAPDALRFFQSGESVGKVVLSV